MSDFTCNFSGLPRFHAFRWNREPMADEDGNLRPECRLDILESSLGEGDSCFVKINCDSLVIERGWPGFAIVLRSRYRNCNWKLDSRGRTLEPVSYKLLDELLLKVSQHIRPPLQEDLLR